MLADDRQESESIPNAAVVDVAVVVLPRAPARLHLLLTDVRTHSKNLQQDHRLNMQTAKDKKGSSYTHKSTFKIRVIHTLGSNERCGGGVCWVGDCVYTPPDGAGPG